ncbi:MAG: hypothetical protein QM772_11665 [Ottowia sp.]|uniref:hypothetical protein n=1 Tax=Ottowia sp. TaxID=1898956 RepID=UPI0039E6FCFB
MIGGAALLAGGHLVHADPGAWLPAGTRRFAHHDESSAWFDEAVIRLKGRYPANGGRVPYGGKRLAAAADVTDAQLRQSIDQQLGPRWRRAPSLDSGSTDLQLYVWEPAGGAPARFYALMAWQHTMKAVDGTVYRPLQTMYVEAVR